MNDGPQTKAGKKAQGAKIGALIKEGYKPKQAVAVSYAEFKKGGVKRLEKMSGKKY